MSNLVMEDVTMGWQDEYDRSVEAPLRAEIEALKHDIERHLEITSVQAETIDRLMAQNNEARILLPRLIEIAGRNEAAPEIDAARRLIAALGE